MAKLKLESLIKLNNRPTKTLAPLKSGQTVNVQNQTGPKPLRWERTGIVMETLPHRQYTIRMDGSGRLSLRNRKFLRPTTPLHVEPLHAEASTWTQQPPSETDDNMYDLDRVAEAAPVPAPGREPASSPTPARVEQTPVRARTPAPRRLAERITAADGSAKKDKRIRLGPEETSSIPPPTPARQPRQSRRLQNLPAEYDLSESLVITSSTWRTSKCT